MSKKKIILFGVIALVILTGCLGGGGDGLEEGDGGDVGDGNENGMDGDGNENGMENNAEDVTVAVAVTLGEDAPPGVAERLNLSRSDQQLFQQARQSPGELSAEERERVQQIQQEIQQARQETQEEQEQAVQERKRGFESTVNSTQTLSVEDSIQQGQSNLFLVSGSPSEILGLLNDSGVQAITGEGQFNQMQQRQQQQRQPPGGGGTPQPTPSP